MSMTADLGFDLLPSDTHDRTLEQDIFESRYVPLRGTDLMSVAASPPPWLFGDLIRQRALVMVSGEPFAGKTLFCLSMALGLDTGTPLLGAYPVSGGHRALFIGQDAPTWDYMGVLAALARGLNLPPGTDLPSIFLLNRGLSFGRSQEFTDMIRSCIKFYDIDVLFLDVLKSFHDYDENSNAEMSRVMDLLKYLRDHFGLTIFFTHHTSKPAGGGGLSSGSNFFGNYRARGASVVSGSIDQHFLLTSTQGRIQISMPKARGPLASLAVDRFTIEQETPVGGRSLHLVPDKSVPSLHGFLRDFFVSGAAGPDPHSLRSLYNVARAQAAFSALTDGQLYNRLSSAARTLERQGLLSQPSRGQWAASAAAAAPPERSDT